MKEEQRTFFNIMDSFRKMNIASMLPDISNGEFAVMKMIRHCRQNGSGTQNGVKVSSIVKCSKMPAPAISRTLKHLEEKEYIVRTVDKEDRRNTFVKMTEAGEALLRETDEIMSDFADAVFGQMGDETMRKLNDYLSRMVETADAEIAKRKYKGKKGETEIETHL